MQRLKIMKTSILIPCSLVVLFSSLGHSQEKHLFPMKWQTGKIYEQKVSLEQVMNTAGQGDMVMKMNMEMEALPKEGAEAGTTELSTTYKAMDATATMAGQELPGIADGVKGLVGKTITVIFDKDGKVTDVKGLEDALDPQAAQMMNADSVKQMMEQSGLLGNPKEPVGPGESWDFSVKTPTPMMTMEMDGSYTYEADEEVDGAKCARLSFRGKVKMGIPDAAEGDAEAAQMKASMEAAGLELGESFIQGVSHYDFEMGSVTKTVMEMSLMMSMNNPVGEGDRIEMPMKNITTQTLKIKDAE